MRSTRKIFSGFVWIPTEAQSARRLRRADGRYPASESELDTRCRLPKLFDAVSHDWLIRFLRHRIGDERILRLIRKWLKAGVFEEGIVTESEAGTPQGATASPLLANVYLHYVFDLWAQQWRKRHAAGT